MKNKATENEDANVQMEDEKLDETLEFDETNIGYVHSVFDQKKGEKMLKLLINSHTIIQNQVAYRKLFVGIMHGQA